MPVRIAIVEDNAGISSAWKRLFMTQPELHCVGAFRSGTEALAALPDLRPDVILMDINLPGLSGIECTARIKELLPQTAILIVTVHSDQDRVFEALQAGASGYLLKRTSSKELLTAIKDVLLGGAPMTGEIARKVIESFRRPVSLPAVAANLTARESEVLKLLATGYSDKEIASRLDISFDTARAHVKHIYEKLHVRCRTEATARFHQPTQTSASTGLKMR